MSFMKSDRKVNMISHHGGKNLKRKFFSINVRSETWPPRAEAK